MFILLSLNNFNLFNITFSYACSQFADKAFGSHKYAILIAL